MQFLDKLTVLDYSVCGVFFVLMALIGVATRIRAGRNTSEFFLSGRNMTWWLLGFSLVATTFAADTPNFVTQLVRQTGIAGNWCWWVFLLTGMTTVFIYAKLWRRLGVLTDIEFYEIRYSGDSAAFVRGFRTLYLGLLFNTVVMANVTLAMIKILGVTLNLPPWVTLVSAGLITVAFSMMGGFTAVIWADFIMFLVAMVGAVALAVVCLGLPEVGGLSGLLSNPDVVPRLNFLPDFGDFELVVVLLVVPFAVQWWGAWYPGAEPGGGSFSAQRMLAAKNENHAVGAVLFFNFCHYAVRPFPWILVALASIIVFPNLDVLGKAFPHLPASMIRDDMAYPAMFQFLPSGWYGLVLTSLFAAYMSTIATHLNLGSSYMVNDFYHRFVNKTASERRLVFMARLWTLLLMVMASVLALFLESAKECFDIILSIGAGTGLIFLLRWFWWRLNAYSEIAAMAISFCVAVSFIIFREPWRATCLSCFGMETASNDFFSSIQLVVSVVVTTIGWLAVTYLTPADDEQTLFAFVRRTGASGPGWRHVYRRAAELGVDLTSEHGRTNVPLGLLCSVVGCVAIYSALFGTGYWIYGNVLCASITTGISLVAWFGLLLAWRRMQRVTVVPR